MGLNEKEEIGGHDWRSNSIYFNVAESHAQAHRTGADQIDYSSGNADGGR